MNYTLTITEQERQVLAEGFGILARKLSNAAPVIEDLRKSNAPLPQSAQSSPAAAPVPTEPHSTKTERDRWARDRKGNEVPNPDGCTAVDVHLYKTFPNEKFLRVTWQASGQGYGNVNCFDKELWPWIIAKTGQTVRLYLVRKGNYTNVVGVRA